MDWGSGTLRLSDILRSILLSFFAYLFNVNVEANGRSYGPRICIVYRGHIGPNWSLACVGSDAIDP
jgi:hypothetical protein